MAGLDPAASGAREPVAWCTWTCGRPGWTLPRSWCWRCSQLLLPQTLLQWLLTAGSADAAVHPSIRGWARAAWRCLKHEDWDNSSERYSQRPRWGPCPLLGKLANLTSITVDRDCLEVLPPTQCPILEGQPPGHPHPQAHCWLRVLDVSGYQLQSLLFPLPPNSRPHGCLRTRCSP